MQTSVKSNRFLTILLTFILVDEVCDNFILSVFAKQSHLYEFIFFSVFLIVSILASPIQAGYSDFYCRKKSLIVALFFSLLSTLFSIFIIKGFSIILFMSLATLAKAGLGNTFPIAWAGLADTKTKDFRFTLGLSTAAMAFGYLVLILIQSLFSDIQSSFSLSIILIIAIYLCVRFFIDARDSKKGNKNTNQKKSILSEIRLIKNNFLKDRRTRKALLTFTLWEISFYSALIVGVDMKIKEFNSLSLSMLLGYLVGVVILKFSRKKTDDEMIKCGYLISIISLLPIFILFPFISIKLLMVGSYFIYSLAAAFLAPSLFSILSSERGSHEQGKIYGLIDSTDTIAFLLASIATMLYNFLQLKVIFLALFSFLMFVISWWTYGQFKKTSGKEN